MRGGLLGLAVAIVCALPAAAALPTGNVIVDPGAEMGTAAMDATHAFAPPNPPWTAFVGGESQVQYGATPVFPGTNVSNTIDGGAAFFAGGPSPPENGNLRHLEQTIDLRPYATEIDGGQIRADLSGFLGGVAGQDDKAQVTADFTDETNETTLLALAIGPVTNADRSGATTLLPRADSGTIPAGARQVVVDVIFTRTSPTSTYNDGYADNLSLTLNPPPPNPPGLPAGLDFTWSPRADVQIAGAPAGGLQFQATPGQGVTYAWDFDYSDGAGFVGDPAASGAAPRHGFTADGAHDAGQIVGSNGQRRRVYTVRLHATAANGTTADVTHQLVVAPDNAPKVDFVTDGSGGPVSGLVTFTPHVSDPDQTTRTADAIDHLEWNFDTAINGQGAVDLICNGDGTNCRLPDGTAPGPWFTAGPNGAAQIDFWRRALAFHGLNPLGDIDLNSLPTTLPTGAPLVGGLGVLNWAKVPFYVEHDPRLAYLYENATLLMQSSFNKDAGEATGAKYSGHAPIARSVQIAQPVINHSHYFDSAFLTYRQVTLTAVDSAGVRTSVTHAVPLRPDSPPRLSARFVNASADGSTKPIAVVPPRTRHGKQAPSGQPLSQILTQPLTVDDQLVYDASATRDPDGQIAYYTLEVGKPFNEPGTCKPGKPFVVGPSGAISLDAPDVNYLPGQFFPGTSSGGTGPGSALNGPGITLRAV